MTHGFGPMFPLYAHLAAPAGAAAGDPDLWTSLSAETYLDICPPSLRPDGPPAWATSAPLRPSVGERGPVPPAVAELLNDEGRRLAYFTLGTVKNQDTDDFRAGLSALSGYDGRVLATTGRALDPDEGLGPVPDNVVLAEFVPQASVLPHADLVVPHCGSGTMLGALALGATRRWPRRGAPTNPRTPPCSREPAPAWWSRRTTTAPTRSGRRSTRWSATRRTPRTRGECGPRSRRCPTRTRCGPAFSA